MNKLLDDAILFAARSHFGRRRPYTNLPYLGHCLEVMEIVASVPHTDAMLIAAVLHDMLEYSGTSPQEISLIFGTDVAKMVLLLSEPSQADRATRQIFMIKQMSAASPEAQTIKLAEILSNARSILRGDSNSVRAYLEDARSLLSVLKKGDATLYRSVVAAVDEVAASLRSLGSPSKSAGLAMQ